MQYSKRYVVKSIIFCVYYTVSAKHIIKWAFAIVYYSLYSNMYDETSVQSTWSMEFSFWCDLFKVSCFLSKTCSLKPNTFKRWRFVYYIPCTRLQNFVNVSPLFACDKKKCCYQNHKIELKHSNWKTVYRTVNPVLTKTLSTMNLYMYIKGTLQNFIFIAMGL